VGSRGAKLLERMRAKPSDWRIEDVRTVCNAFDLDLDRPPGGPIMASARRVGAAI
jgi:hypothetical protein